MPVLAARIPVQTGFAVVRKAIDVVDDAAAVPGGTPHQRGPPGTPHRTTQRRSQNIRDVVDLLPQPLGGRKIELHSACRSQFRGPTASTLRVATRKCAFEIVLLKASLHTEMIFA